VDGAQLEEHRVEGGTLWLVLIRLTRNVVLSWPPTAPIGITLSLLSLSPHSQQGVSLPTSSGERLGEGLTTYTKKPLTAPLPAD